MAKIDARTGLLAGPNSDKTYYLPFKVGTEPTKEANTSPRQESQKASEDILKQLF